MRASLSFLSKHNRYKTEKPYTIYSSHTNGCERTNCEFEPCNDIEITDIRGRDGHDLQTSGFQFVTHASKVPLSLSGFQDSREQHSTVVLPYLRETMHLTRIITEAEKVICFDWRTRSSSSVTADIDGENTLTESRSQILSPARIAHTDYSPEGGRARLQRQLSVQEFEEVADCKLRARVINMWRPLVPVVLDEPLAFCDRRSVDPDDLVDEDKVHDDHWEEGCYLRHNPKHQWCWMSEQRIDEVVFFVTWDSDTTSIPVTTTPHASFHNPNAPTGCLPRASIEVRMMVFTKQ